MGIELSIIFEGTDHKCGRMAELRAWCHLILSQEIQASRTPKRKRYFCGWSDETSLVKMALVKAIRKLVTSTPLGFPVVPVKSISSELILCHLMQGEISPHLSCSTDTRSRVLVLPQISLPPSENLSLTNRPQSKDHLSLVLLGQMGRLPS